MPQQSFDHHYIPVFYLARWTDGGGKVCELSRPWKGVVAKHVGPKGTGFKRHLYTVPGLPPDQQSALEDEFFRNTDTTAAEALQLMIETGGHNMSERLRNGWSLFVNGLVQRNPEKVARLKEESAKRAEALLERVRVDAGKGQVPSLPKGQTFQEFAAEFRRDVCGKIWADVLQSVVDNGEVGLFISNMRWSVVTLQTENRRFLTSDRPVIMTNGVNHPEGHIVLPISPTQLFVAVNTEEMEAQLRPNSLREANELIGRINDRIVSNAQRFVYSMDDRPVRFVENRLGRRSPSVSAPT